MTTAQRIARLQRELYPDLAVLLRELQQPVPPPEGDNYSNWSQDISGKSRGIQVCG